MDRYEGFRKKATEVAEMFTPEWHAEFCILRMGALLKQLPSRYGSLADALGDWFADMPWTEAANLKTRSLILGDPRFSDLQQAAEQEHAINLRNAVEGS